MAAYRYEHNSSGSFAVNLSTIWFQAYCSFSLLRAETCESLREDRLADLPLPVQKNGLILYSLSFMAARPSGLCLRSQPPPPTFDPYLLREFCIIERLQYTSHPGESAVSGDIA